MPPPSDLHDRLLTAFRAESAEQIAEMRRILKLPSPTEEDLDEAFRFAHSMKGGARVCDLTRLESAAHGLESELAAVRAAGRESFAQHAPALLLLLDSVEDVARLELHGQQDTPVAAEAQNADSSTTPIAAGTAGAATVRIATEHLDQLLSISGRLLAELLPQEQMRDELGELTQTLGQIDRDLESILEQLRTEAGGAELHALTRLDDWRRQLVDGQRQTRRLTSLQARTQMSLRALSQEFTREIHSSRLVAARVVFEGFGTMVRDIAKERGREVTFRADGLDAMSDRSVLQRCKDPVMHLLRNAVAHGIESPEDRERAGKSRTGTVHLQVETRGQRLHIIVEDDGAGIPLERLRRIAAEKGVLSSEAMWDLSDQDLLQLIFHSGLSTAENLTEMAGRGMGLSVVDANVRRLGGTVSVNTERGRGTRFDLETSLTISAQHLILVQSGAQRIGIPSSNIVRLLRVRPDELAQVDGTRRYTFQQQSLPVTTLSGALGIPSVIPNASDGGLRDAMIIRSRERHLCLLVDKLHEQREAVVHELDGPAALPMYAGAAMMESGALVPVLHVAELFAHSRATALVEPTADAPSAKRQQRILVVDDSFTTRTLERSILEAHGYRVTVAVDGVEALARLRSEPVDLVISDIQMPRMDGFTLVTEIKADSKLKQIPVVLVSSMEAPEDQERGLAVGAEAYIVKRKFDHEELVATIRQLL